MRVLYVVVLALVAGAVTCYGRTESEGTLFNKTQIHESMNNGTESSSKFGVYGYLYLAMQWPRSYCGNNCRQVRGHFTVHGLWPQRNTYPKKDIDCNYICNRNKMLFRRSQLPRYLLPGLNEYWPNLDPVAATNYEFWASEYNTHGCCTFYSQDLYFSQSLKMVESLGDLALKLSLIGVGRILPGIRYMPQDIVHAVQEVTHHSPLLVCNRPRESPRPQLFEIRFLYSHDLRPIPYNGHPLFCGNGEVDFPVP